jgi:hypothetical protein
MLAKLVAIIIFYPAMVWGNCPYPQQNFPMEQQDEQHALGVKVRELKTARSNLEKQLPQINADIARARNSVHYYLRAPWGDSVIAHMDNGFDCCDSSQKIAKRESKENNRRPAGTDIVDMPVSGGEVVDPIPYGDDPSYPEPSYPEPSNPGSDNSCYGYSKEYCQQGWGKNESPSNGGLCLQTGFAATTAWYNASCRSGGRVNPGICGDARISNYPNDYQQCVQILNDYYRLSRAKRRLSGQVQAYNDEIKGLNRGRARGFGASVVNFLKTAGPFLLMAYIANQQSKSTREQYQSYRPPYSGTVGSIGQPNSLSGRYASVGSRPPAFFGSDYGHPFQSGGMMGQILPALMSGSFGCSTGGGSSLGGLESFLPMLAGGINGGLPSTPGSLPPPNDGNGWIGPARPSTGPRGSYFGQERDAVFYDMLGGARQRLANHQQESQQISDYLSGNGSLPASMSGAQPGTTFAPGMESFGLIQSLLMGGGSANATFSLQSVPPGF